MRKTLQWAELPVLVCIILERDEIAAAYNTDRNAGGSARVVELFADSLDSRAFVMQTTTRIASALTLS
jgi:hypothetical protein